MDQLQSTTEEPEKFACASEPTNCHLKEVSFRQSDLIYRAMLARFQRVRDTIDSLANVTRCRKLESELNLLKGRQAVAGALQVTQFFS